MHACVCSFLLHVAAAAATATIVVCVEKAEEEKEDRQEMCVEDKVFCNGK